MRSLRAKFCTLALVASLALVLSDGAVTSTAIAADSTSADNSPTITIESGLSSSSPVNSTTVLHFDKDTSQDLISSVMATLRTEAAGGSIQGEISLSTETGGSVSATANSQSDIGSPVSPYPIQCDGNGYYFRDGNGTMFWRSQCSFRNMIWAYRLSPFIQSIVVGTVREGGLGWSLNEVGQSQNAPHSEAAGYRWHGSVGKKNRVGILQNRDRVEYSDQFFYRFNVGGTTGSAVTRISGNLVVIR